MLDKCWQVGVSIGVMVKGVGQLKTGWMRKRRVSRMKMKQQLGWLQLKKKKMR